MEGRLYLILDNYATICFVLVSFKTEKVLNTKLYSSTIILHNYNA